jgi:hypothetical protein
VDAEELAHRQYLLGLLNRRMARHMERLDDVFSEVAGLDGVLTLLCACGREDCDQPLLRISSEEYDRVRESPHRFLIAPGHTTEIDEIVFVGDGYAIVELRPEYRQADPATADELSPAPRSPRTPGTPSPGPEPPQS